MRIFWKAMFSLFGSVVFLLAIEYVAIQGDKINGRPIAAVGIAQAIIIYRALTSFEREEKNNVECSTR